MALDKEVVAETGVSLNYHRVINVCLDMLEESFSVSVASYVSKAARDSGKLPAKERFLQLPFSPGLLSDSVNLITRCYTVLKTTEEFLNSNDI